MQSWRSWQQYTQLYTSVFRTSKRATYKCAAECIDSAASPSLRHQLWTARQQVAKYRSMVRSNQKLQWTNATTGGIVEAASKFLKGTALDLFACQLKCASRPSGGRRLTGEDKLMALSIYHQSPAAYRLLCTIINVAECSLFASLAASNAVWTEFL